MDIATVAYIGIFVGCLLRLFIAYYEKYVTEGVSFDVKYVLTVIVAIIISFVIASQLVMAYKPPEDVTSMAVIFGSAMLQGWGTTDLTNKLGVDWWRKKEAPA